MNKQIKTESPLRYVPVTLIIQVACTGCGKTFAPKKPASVLSLDDAHAAAMAYHNASALICPKREFIITFTQQLVDERIINKNQSGVVPG